MSEHESNEAKTMWGASRDEAPSLFQLLRQQLLTYGGIPLVGNEGASQVEASSKMLAVDDLPAELQRLVERYQKEHASVRLEPVRYASVGDPGEARGLFAAAELPENEELVMFVSTETIASMKRFEVRSRVLLARRRSAE